MESSHYEMILDFVYSFVIFSVVRLSAVMELTCFSGPRGFTIAYAIDMGQLIVSLMIDLLLFGVNHFHITSHSDYVPISVDAFSGLWGSADTILIPGLFTCFLCSYVLASSEKCGAGDDQEFGSSLTTWVTLSLVQACEERVLLAIATDHLESTRNDLLVTAGSILRLRPAVKSSEFERDLELGSCQDDVCKDEVEFTYGDDLHHVHILHQHAYAGAASHKDLEFTEEESKNMNLEKRDYQGILILFIVYEIMKAIRSTSRFAIIGRSARTDSSSMSGVGKEDITTAQFRASDLESDVKVGLLPLTTDDTKCQDQDTPVMDCYTTGDKTNTSGVGSVDYVVRFS